MAIIFFFVLIVFITFPSLFYNFSSIKIHGDLTTILSIINYLNHIPLGEVYHLPFLYPLSFLLTKTHPLFGVAIFFKIFHFLGFNLKESTSLYIIFSLVIGAFGCYLLAKEVSQSRTFSLLFSVLFIVHPQRNFHFVWLNFLSVFYIPFIFFFFIRFFKTGKKHFGILAALFALFQFMSSIYYGVFLWGIMIPLFFIFAFLLKMVSFARLRQQVTFLLIAALLIMFIFYPFIDQNKSGENKFQGNLVRSLDIFAYSKVLTFFLEKKTNTASRLFPGFLFTFFFLVLFWINLPKRRVASCVVLSGSVVVMSILAFINLFILELVFLIFLVLLLVLTVILWKYVDRWTKLMVLSLAAFFLFFFKLSLFGISGDITLFGLFNLFLPVEGLRHIYRAAFVMMPFFIVGATLGATKLFGSWNGYSNRKKQIIFLVLLALLLSENKWYPFSFLNPSKFRMEEKKTNLEVYKYLPFKKNKIILEVPFNFSGLQKNSRYTINWIIHQNALLNGKVSIRPASYLKKLKNVIGPYQMQLLTEKRLTRLIRNYSVNYIIFHLDLFKKKIRNPEFPIKKYFLEKLESVGQIAKLVYENDKTILIKIQEYFPIKNITRTYSYYHLKKNRLFYKLLKKYNGKIRLFLNQKLLKIMDSAYNEIVVDLRKEKLNVEGNTISLIFDRPVKLLGIEINR